MTSKKLGNLLRSVPPAVAAERTEPLPEPAPAAQPAPPGYGARGRANAAGRSSPKCRCRS